MRKVTFFLMVITLTLVSCSKDDSENINSINPPSWLLGIWEDENESFEVVFTKDDFILSDMSYKEMISLANKYGGNTVTTKETVSNTQYVLTFINPGEAPATYSFTKLTDNKINFSLINQEVVLFRK